MPEIARHVKFTAKPGEGDALAALLLDAAKGAAGVPGCALYLVNRAADDADVIWVTEAWSGQEALDASLESDASKAQIAAAMPLIAATELIALTPAGGHGLTAPNAGASGFARVNLDSVEDAAAKHGFGETGEARFATRDLDAQGIGLALHRLRAGCRQGFAHRHEQAEEVYVVLEGSGRVKVDDAVVEVGPLDAVRIAPRSIRAIEADAGGLQVLAFGTRHGGDTEMFPGWWD